MSVEYTLETHAQPSLYNPVPRKLTTYFDLPDDTNKKLNGMLLLIPGFGGHANSNVFKKMRRIFADEYDLITLECDFFGYEYMLSEVLPESPSSFNDMGPVQVMDMINSIKNVVDYCRENNIDFDDTNVIAYGFSQGGYLAYLLNYFMPDMLSCVIDNSGWVYPQYLPDDRILYQCNEKGEIVNQLVFHYLIRDICMDPQIYSLDWWSMTQDNSCRVISFHSYTDTLAAIQSKILVLSRIKNSSVEIIGKERVDGLIFNSDSHGLGADFLELFRYVMERYNTQNDKPVLQFKSKTFETGYCKYHIDMDDVIPLLTYENKVKYDFEKYRLLNS